MQETEAKRKRLASTKRRSLALLAEVKYDSSWALALWLHVTASIILLLLLLLFSFTNCVAASCRKVLEKEVPVLSEGWTEVTSTSKNSKLDLNQDSVLASDGVHEST
jgi:hypothetical protein